ncbi:MULTISPECIES: phage head morphogenesis protein [Pandoraea]|uniref:phage head morphogenesis protein n=1 Tax=Pandoraea TaxID=93217 RepID=UPI0003D22991|nr:MULTISPECIES: phage minor head protein [Pandoraea]AHB77583.1 phage head morphogenesis protein [Pandoraea pnomenusa]
MSYTVDRMRKGNGKRNRNRNPVRTTATEARYRTQLRKIASHVAALVNGVDDDLAGVPTLEQVLRQYSDALDGWARRAAAQMLDDVARNDASAWSRLSDEIGRALSDEIRNAPTGQTLFQLMEEQVGLIKSIPLDAARRVHELAIDGLSTGRRAADISRDIQNSGGVVKSRADLIARTEVSRSASSLTEARARHVGSEGYFWRTAGDGDVRHSHAEMEGKYVRWDSPPTLDGMTGHAGCFPNCRCYPEPDLPD